MYINEGSNIKQIKMLHGFDELMAFMLVQRARETDAKVALTCKDFIRVSYCVRKRGGS